MKFAAIYYLNVAGAIFGFIGDILSTLNQVFFNMVEGLLGMLETLVTKTPYPQDGSGNPQFFGRPAGDMWGPMYDMYQTTSDLTLIILMIILVVVAGVRIFDDYLPSYANGNQAGTIVKMMFATALWWPIGVAMLMLSDLLAQAVLTLSSETNVNGETADGLQAAFLSIKNHPDMGFSSGGGGVEGIVLSLALLIPFIIQSAVMILLVFLWIIRYMFIYLLMPVMPLIFALMAFNMPGSDDLQDVGQTTIEMYISLVFLTFPAAVIIVVFGRMASKMVDMIDTVITGSGGTSATMTLADGAAATGDVAGIVSSVTTLIIGIGFMSALPLIAAGGPFILLGSGNEGIKDAAMGTAAGALTGGVTTAAGAAGSFGSDLLGDEEVEVEAEGGSASSGASGSGSADADAETGDAGTEAEAGASASRMGKMKQKMSSSINTASNLKENWQEKSAGEKARAVGGGAAAATAMMGGKVKEEGEFMRRKGVSEYARTKGGNAKNKVGNALTKGKVGAGDGMANLKDRKDDLTDSIDQNLDKSRNKLSRIKENPAEELSQTASQAGSAVMNSYRKKDFNQMSKKEKEELMRDMGMYEEWKEGDKTAEELYMGEKTTERTTTQDIMEDRAKENKEKRDQISSELETKLKAAGAWDDYTSGMSARDALEKNTDGQELKAEDFSYKEAHKLGLNPAEGERRSKDMNFNTDTGHSRNADVNEFYDMNKDKLPFDDASQMKSWMDDNGLHKGDLGSKQFMETVNNKFASDDEVMYTEATSFDTTVTEGKRNSTRDDIDGKTRKGYTQKYSAEEIEEHARQSGYVDENGNVKTNEYLQQEIDSKERKGRDTVQTGQMNDSMASVFDDVDRAEGVYTEDVAQEVDQLDQELDNANSELNRAGKHIEGEDLTDTDMSQAERNEIVSGDVSGSDTNRRDDMVDETVGDTGSGTRDLQDVPNERTGGSTTTDTEDKKDSAAAEAVGEMFS